MNELIQLTISHQIVLVVVLYRLNHVESIQFVEKIWTIPRKMAYEDAQAEVVSCVRCRKNTGGNDWNQGFWWYKGWLVLLCTRGSGPNLFYYGVQCDMVLLSTQWNPKGSSSHLYLWDCEYSEYRLALMWNIQFLKFHSDNFNLI